MLNSSTVIFSFVALLIDFGLFVHLVLVLENLRSSYLVGERAEKTEHKNAAIRKTEPSKTNLKCEVL